MPKPSDQPTGEKMMQFIFKHNRSYELHIGGRVAATFAPNESKQLPASILKHPDFTPEVSRCFVIREVTNG